jgi:hypothetical protein
VILVQTSLTSDPAASEGQVSINIHGEYGDTGERRLSGKSPWKPGEEASFIIESISLGALSKIKLQYEGQGRSISTALCSLQFIHIILQDVIV